MNVMELGALGEFVSSIAVVLTLAYLAFQTRLNSISTRGLFHLWSNAHRQHLNGTLDAAIYKGIVQEVSAYAEGSRDEVAKNEELARRGKPMRWAWEFERYLFNPEFQLFVDEHLGIER